ncbi:MAG: DUF4832 domain-containing protein [Firmicutes bacterium]|nr:DUF4832 domain-containing protein [Bacillota bacterium]
MLYKRDGEALALSERLAALSDEYSGLTEEHSTLTGEHTALSNQFSALLGHFSTLWQNYLEARGHGMGTAESFEFTESARELKNPNRGFYHMHGYFIKDEVRSFESFQEDLGWRYAKDNKTSLTMIQINLQYFKSREISEKGLQSLDNLFRALEEHVDDKHLIIRFLYDWDGKNLQYEPDSLDTILRHIEQVGPWLKEHSDQIFLTQGLFIGSWGEMHSSKFLGTENYQALAEALYEATADSTYLSVRMPAQWRMITGIGDPSLVDRGDGTLASRLGLFNDGMLGSWSDYGTYGDQTRAEHGDFTFWNRQEELAFQDILCRIVPIGGEIMNPNSYNDFENALADMKAMHVTYANRDFDTRVFNKWEKTTVQEDGCFNGMDGLTYMERHLGYRLVLRKAELEYDWKEDGLTAEITLQNVGFAPIYRETQVELVLYDREHGREYSYVCDPTQDIRDLAGGTQSDEQKTLRWELSMGGMPQGEYEVYFHMSDALSGEIILLGNEQDPDRIGYRVGTLKLGETEEIKELWKQEFPEWMARILE